MIELAEEAYDGAIATALVAALLADLNERYAAQGVGMIPEELAAADARYLAEVTVEQLTRPRGAFVVARLGGAPAGCGAVRELDDRRDVGEIKRMYTVPAHRGRGVARAVLGRLEAIAVELGLARMQLETGTEQPEAVALYDSSGWARIEPYGHYKDWPTSVCFGKDLRPS